MEAVYICSRCKRRWSTDVQANIPDVFEVVVHGVLCETCEGIMPDKGSRDDEDQVGDLRQLEIAYSCLKNLKMRHSKEGREYWDDVKERLARIYYNAGRPYPSQRSMSAEIPAFRERGVGGGKPDYLGITKNVLGVKR